MARQAQADLEREKKELEDSYQRISEQAQRKVSGREANVGNEGGVHPSRRWALTQSLVFHSTGSWLGGLEPVRVLREAHRVVVISEAEGVRSDWISSAKAFLGQV